MTQDRIHRPTLDRTRPIRGRAAPFAAPDADGHTAPPGDGAPATDLEGVVSRSVELGYRVIDDYVQSGKRAAARLRSGEADAGGLGDDVQDLGTRMVRYASDLVATWAEMLERSAGNAPAPGEPAPATAPPPAAVTAVPLRVRVEIFTRRRVVVTVDLEPGVPGRRLVAHALRATEPGLPRIDDVAFATDATGQAVLHVRIPDDHPAGTYLGLVADETSNLPLGTLELQLAPPDDQAP